MKKKTTDSTSRKVQNIKPIIIEDDDDQDISNQMGTKSSTIGDTKSSIKHPSNQICSHPNIRLPPRPPDPLDQITRLQQELSQILILRKIPPQEGIITETYKSLDKSYLEQPQELSDLVDSTKIIHKYLSKQVDIDKIMDIIKKKVLKGKHLPLTIKEIQAGYLSSSFFKDLFVYLAHYKLPNKKNTI